MGVIKWRNNEGNAKSPFADIFICHEAMTTLRTMTTPEASFKQHGLPPGLKFAPRGELGPTGWTLSPTYGECSPFCSPAGMNTLHCLEEWRGKQRISLLGDKVHSWGTTSPLGSKFAPRGEVKNGPLFQRFSSTKLARPNAAYWQCDQKVLGKKLPRWTQKNKNSFT
jgi:hypothetical protein